MTPTFLAIKTATASIDDLQAAQDLFDTLITGKKLTKAEKQQEKFSVKKLYKKLTENKMKAIIEKNV